MKCIMQVPSFDTHLNAFNPVIQGQDVSSCCTEGNQIQHTNTKSQSRISINDDRPNNSIRPLQMLLDRQENDPSNQRRDRISYLFLDSIAEKDMIEREGLQGSDFSLCEISRTARMALSSSVTGDASRDTRVVPYHFIGTSSLGCIDVVVRRVTRDFGQSIADTIVGLQASGRIVRMRVRGEIWECFSRAK